MQKETKYKNHIHDLYCETCGVRLGKYWGNKPPKGVKIYCGYCGTLQKPTVKQSRYVKRILK